jgi:hypothetical protein
MQLFGDLDLDILSFVRISRLNWIGHVNRMDSKINVTQVIDSNYQGCRLRGQKEKRMVELCITNCKEK